MIVRGRFGDTTVASRAADVATSLEDAGYEADEWVAIRWDATTINFPAAESETEDVGAELAEMAEEFYDSGGGNIGLTGHCWAAASSSRRSTTSTTPTNSRPSLRWGRRHGLRFELRLY